MILHKHEYHRSHLRSKDLGEGSSPCIRIKLLSPSPDGTCKQYSSVAKFIVPDWGIVDSGIGLPYGRYDNPMPELKLSPQSGTMNLATVHWLLTHKVDDVIKRLSHKIFYFLFFR